MSRSSWIILAAVIVAALGLTLWVQGGGQRPAVSVKVPQFTQVAVEGEKLFTRHCMACHGVYAGGTDQGPPLVHKIYEPNHHSDGSFYRAAAQGVRRHHWPFGDMPPVQGAKRNDVAKIVRYVRELQKANGIY